MFRFSKRSLDNLEKVHPDLKKVAHEALKITPIDFVVIEGLRSKEKQKKLFLIGASTTMNSRHLTGHAIDIAAFVDGTIRWDWPLYDTLGKVLKKSAKDLDIDLTWGGDWKNFKDGCHFELSWRSYPIEGSNHV